MCMKYKYDHEKFDLYEYIPYDDCVAIRKTINGMRCDSEYCYKCKQGIDYDINEHDTLIRGLLENDDILDVGINPRGKKIYIKNIKKMIDN